MEIARQGWLELVNVGRATGETKTVRSGAGAWVPGANGREARRRRGSRLGLGDENVSTLRTTAESRPPLLPGIPVEVVDAAASEPRSGSGFALGVRTKRKGEKADCTLCLQSVPIDGTGALAVHDRPAFALMVTRPTSNPLEVETAVAELREAADHWSGRIWRHA
jgi:hypothetical protein